MFWKAAIAQELKDSLEAGSPSGYLGLLHVKSLAADLGRPIAVIVEPPATAASVGVRLIFFPADPKMTFPVSLSKAKPSDFVFYQEFKSCEVEQFKSFVEGESAIVLIHNGLSGGVSHFDATEPISASG